MGGLTLSLCILLGIKNAEHMNSIGQNALSRGMAMKLWKIKSCWQHGLRLGNSISFFQLLYLCVQKGVSWKLSNQCQHAIYRLKTHYHLPASPNTKSPPNSARPTMNWDRRIRRLKLRTWRSGLPCFYLSLWSQHGTYLPYLPIRVEHSLAVSYKLGDITRPTRPTKNSRKYSEVGGSMNE